MLNTTEKDCSSTPPRCFEHTGIRSHTVRSLHIESAIPHPQATLPNSIVQAQEEDAFGMRREHDNNREHQDSFGFEVEQHRHSEACTPPL